ncbi:hypothetical protein H9Q72_012242 [Fusarium xylarioides]|uniref:F-box domain-containing protein n=1 Tax=Fusarium xylarioides TaxID=221167 RepID=A0A9P7HHV6_9HYPO|nr:hypothetical protein H9Q72_012242 [Fusarium xylarioides]
MAGSGTTPALATMPAEIVCMIGAHLSIYVIRAWTLASKRFRDIFLPQICKRIKFSGNMEQLENNILSYFQTATASFRDLVHHNIRCVTFDVQAFDTPRTLRAWVRHPPTSLLQIGRFIISNPNLHRVAFNTHLKDFKEICLFMDLVEAGPPWPNVKNLSIKSPDDDAGLIRALIHKLEEGTLQTLSTCSNIFLTPRRMRDSYYANVISLSLRRWARQDWLWLSRHNDPVIAGLDVGVLNTIHTWFPQLESLVLYDGFMDHSSSSGSLANGAMVVRVIRQAYLTLDKMQSLRRFAFNFNKSRLGPGSIPEILELIPSAFNDLFDDDFEDEELAGGLVLSLLVSQISTIQELCMTTEYPNFYRATRTDGEWDIAWNSFDDPSQKYLFPKALMD